MREGFRDARHLTATGSLTDEARVAVRAGEPQLTFRGKLKDTPQTRYGQHWFYGDKVKIHYAGRKLDARITGIEVTVYDNGDESIFARYEIE